jgi:hypothetical protein
MNEKDEEKENEINQNFNNKTFDKLKDIQILIRKESSLKGLCKSKAKIR